LDSIQNDGVSEGLREKWTFLYNVGRYAFVRFNQVPLGDGYRRFRVAYGNLSNAPAKLHHSARPLLSAPATATMSRTHRTR
jgi:hypothetical protein